MKKTDFLVQALASFPDAGTGCQADALSLAFIMEEAKKLARGSMTYLILITDCAWNRSFHTEKSGQEEMTGFFQSLKEEMGEKLHTTLVGLGVNQECGFEELLDKVILLNKEELADPVKAAEKINMYVASCMKERRRWIQK